MNQKPGARALIGHEALALTPGGPLGLVHLDLWGEDPEAPPRPPGKPLPVAERESQKWGEALQAIEERLQGQFRVLVWADREADLTGYLTRPRPPWLPLLARAAQDRVVYTEGDQEAEERGYLFGVAAASPVLGTFQGRVPRRAAQAQQIILPSREAALEIRAREIELRPRGAGYIRQIAELNADRPPGAGGSPSGCPRRVERTARA